MKYQIIYIFLFSVVFSSCYKEINMDKYRNAPVLVINAWAIADSTVIVSLTHTWFSNDVPLDVFVRDAEIGMSVNGEFVEFLEWTEIEEAYDDYKYIYVSQHRPKEGDHIKLVAVSEEYGTAIAEEYIPQRTKIENIQVLHQWRKSDYTTTGIDGLPQYISKHEFIYKITFRDQPGVKNYYFVEFLPYGDTFSVSSIDYSRETVFLSQENEMDIIFGLEGISRYSNRVFSDDLFEGQEYTLTISEIDVYMGDMDYISREVRLYSIPESYYKYQFSVQLLQSEGVIKKLSDIGFADPIRIQSNVEGGTGLLATSASTFYRLQATVD